MVSRDVRGGSGVVRGLAALAGCALLTACGGPGTPRQSLAGRVCDGARQASATALGSPVSARIVSPQAADLRCVLTGRQVRMIVDSQAGARAYTEFDTEVTHQNQVFGPGIHEPGQIPSVITVPGSVVAVWIPAQNLLVATNATPTTSGAYVTVSVSGVAPAATALPLATAAAQATFTAHPNDPR